MCEMTGIQLGQAVTVVDGLSDDKKRVEPQTVAPDNGRKVGQHATIYTLPGPRQFVTYSHRCVGRILTEQLFLHILHYIGTQVDAHRGAGACQQMQFLGIGHRRPSLTAGQDYCLCLAGYGELGTQFAAAA